MLIRRMMQVDWVMHGGETGIGERRRRMATAQRPSRQGIRMPERCIMISHVRFLFLTEHDDVLVRRQDLMFDNTFLNGLQQLLIRAEETFHLMTFHFREEDVFHGRWIIHGVLTGPRCTRCTAVMSLLFIRRTCRRGSSFSHHQSWFRFGGHQGVKRQTHIYTGRSLGNRLRVTDIGVRFLEVLIVTCLCFIYRLR